MGQLSIFTTEINTVVIGLCNKHVNQLRIEIDQDSRTKVKIDNYQMIACIGHEIIVTSYVPNNEKKQKKKVHHGFDCKSAWFSWFGNTIAWI